MDVLVDLGSLAGDAFAGVGGEAVIQLRNGLDLYSTTKDVVNAASGLASGDVDQKAVLNLAVSSAIDSSERIAGRQIPVVGPVISLYMDLSGWGNCIQYNSYLPYIQK